MVSIEERRKADKIIWWLMITFSSIIIVGGGAWASMINTKVDKIASLEANVQNIQSDISSIKLMFQSILSK